RGLGWGAASAGTVTERRGESPSPGICYANPGLSPHVGRGERSPYFFFAGPKSGCHAASLRLGAAAITLVLSFFGFLASRLLRCCPLDMIFVSCGGSNEFGSTDCS